MIINLKKANNVENVGNKAKGLYDLIKLGLNVPNGFVIKAEANLEEIRKYIKKNCDKNKLYVVRSSSNFEDSTNHSFAGLFDTYIGIKKNELVENILNVMYMNNNQRLNDFCKKMNINKNKIKVCVIVQEILPSEISGICFTKHPNTNNSNQIYIEAILGLGEYIVSGEVNPDSYILNKKNLKIKSIKPATQHKMLILRNENVIDEPVFSYTQKMTDELLIELGKKVKIIEKFYNTEMDLEFGIFKNKLYLLQARPITT